MNRIQPLPPLPRLRAVAYLGAPARGQRKPLFYACEPLEISQGDPAAAPGGGIFLVKSVDAIEPMVREVLGNRLAKLAGILTPEPALIEIDLELANLTNLGRRRVGIFSNHQSGFAAGARQFTASNVEHLQFVKLSTQNLESALRLYVFDMLAGHSDRVESNPNCCVVGGTLVVFDFEQCFDPNPRLIAEGVQAWNYASQGLGRLHMFHPTLKGSPNIDQVVVDILNVYESPELLKSTLRGFPESWIPEATRILEQIHRIVHNKDAFREDIVRSLSA